MTPSNKAFRLLEYRSSNYSAAIAEDLLGACANTYSRCGLRTPRTSKGREGARERERERERARVGARESEREQDTLDSTVHFAK